MRAENSGRRTHDAVLDEGAEDLYEHAPCGYLSTLVDGTVVRVNQTLLDWIGWSRPALLADTKTQGLLSIGSRIYYETHCAPLLQLQGFANEIALELVCADGHILPVLVNARQRRDPQGAPLLNRITLFDATDRRRYERELLLARRRAEEVAKDKAALLAMLSHDIRNPLNALMGVVQLLDRSELTDAQRGLVRVLRSSSDHMLTLLDHVLELSKVESSSFALVETPFSLAAVVDDVIGTFEAKAREKALQLCSRIDEGVPSEMIGDPVAVRQILTNLVGNAVKFTERGTVVLSVTARQRTVDAVVLNVAVSDTGIGIAPDVMDRIFKEFTQASYETAIKFGGTGLGLTIARKLLGLYGSRMEVTSVPKQGSTFSFDLRLAVSRQAAARSG